MRCFFSLFLLNNFKSFPFQQYGIRRLDNKDFLDDFDNFEKYGILNNTLMQDYFVQKIYEKQLQQQTESQHQDLKIENDNPRDTVE